MVVRQRGFKSVLLSNAKSASASVWNRGNTAGSTYCRRVRDGRHFSLAASVGENVKAYKMPAELGVLLVSPGMEIDDPNRAVALLLIVSYYRLIGFWHPFRKQTSFGRENGRYADTRFRNVVTLYHFDLCLPSTTFFALALVELEIRALLGQELRATDSCARLKVSVLGLTAHRGDTTLTRSSRYENELKYSRNDVLDQYRRRYGGSFGVSAASAPVDHRCSADRGLKELLPSPAKRITRSR